MSRTKESDQWEIVKAFPSRSDSERQTLPLSKYKYLLMTGHCGQKLATGASWSPLFMVWDYYGALITPIPVLYLINMLRFCVVGLRQSAHSPPDLSFSILVSFLHFLAFLVTIPDLMHLGLQPNVCSFYLGHSTGCRAGKRWIIFFKWLKHHHHVFVDEGFYIPWRPAFPFTTFLTLMILIR